MSVQELLTHGGGQYGVALHIGSGSAPAGLWKGLTSAVIAVEPDPDLAALARQNLEGFEPPSQVLEGAISEVTGRASLMRRNLAALSSAREATGALEVFRGLRVVDHVPTECWSPADIFKKTGLREMTGRKALLIEAPSETQLVLTALLNSGDLAEIDTIVAIIPEIEMHSGGGDRASIEAWAQLSNFRLVYETNPDDRDLRYARIEAVRTGERIAPALNDHSIEDTQVALRIALKDVKALRALLSERDAELEEALDLLGESESELAKASTRIEALEERCLGTKRRADALRKKARRAEIKLEAAADLEAQLSVLSAEKAALEASSAELESKLSGVSAEKQDLEDSLSDLESKVLLLNEEKQALQSDIDEVRDELRCARVQAEDIEQKQQEGLRLQSELAAAREDLRLALRVQRIAQADLADLQERYDQLFSEKRDVEDLLEQVAVRLSEHSPEVSGEDAQALEEGQESQGEGGAPKGAGRPARGRKS